MSCKSQSQDQSIRRKTVRFSKDNPIVEISSKQSQTQKSNVVPPKMPKEPNKKTR